MQIYTDLIATEEKLIEKPRCNRIMNTSKRYIIPFTVMAITSLSSYNYSPTKNTTANSETPAPTNGKSFSTPSMAQLRAKKYTVTEPPLLKESPNKSVATDKNINTTLYTSNTQCQELIPKPVSVSNKEPVTSVVTKILEQRDTADFSLSGYRVSIKDGVATVDLRISPHSQRQLTSLSSCEQFALFGSLRKTLTSNAQWNIKKVRFTELGKDIIL